jgi:hypothetical protein
MERAPERVEGNGEEMNAPAETGTALTAQARASIALGAAEHEKRLVALAKASTDLVEIRDTASYQQIHGARMSLKRARLELENIGEGAREDAKNFAKAVIAEQKRLIAIVEPEEIRLQAIQKAHDDKVEAERQAKIQAEQNRIAEIQSLIAEIKDVALANVHNTATPISIAMKELEQFQIDERFGEFKPEGEQAKVSTMNRLNELFNLATAREEAARAEAESLATEQDRIKAESEELARRQAEQVARERAEQERLALERRQREEEEAAAKAQRQAEEAASKARIEAQERAAAEARAKADAEAMALRIAEEARLRSIREAEEEKLRKEADRLAKERQAAEERERKKQDAIEAKAKAKREKEEAAERARFAKEQEKMDARQMLEAFVTRFGHLEEYRSVVEAINALEGKAKAAP